MSMPPYTDYPDLQALSLEEEVHEKSLIALINEERLEYMGSVVLGLNDALVEFTGALAGFTLALKRSQTHCANRQYHRYCCSTIYGIVRISVNQVGGRQEQAPDQSGGLHRNCLPHYSHRTREPVYPDRSCLAGIGSDADHGTPHHCLIQLLLRSGTK